MNGETLSLTSDLKNYLRQPRKRPAKSRSAVIGDLDSVYARAMEAGMSLAEYVASDPDRALREAEASVALWDRVMQTAALKGGVETEDGEYLPVNKDGAKILKERSQKASRDLQTVRELLQSVSREGTKRKDVLIEALYKKAVDGGDTRALLYMIDRIDGRPGEAKVLSVDYDNAYNVYQIVHTCFDKQLEVLNSGPGTKIVLCSRRAGKTRLCAALLLIESLRCPNTTSIYIGATMEMSEELLNTAINEIIDECGLKDSRGLRLNWRKFDNGSKILVRGLSNTKDPDQIRGFKAKVIVIDEFFHLKSDLLEYLMREVLEPMQMDYASEYKFLCCGTPSPIKGTFGDHAYDEWNVPKFSWNAFDNPFPKGEDKEAYIDRKLKEKGLDWSSTYARREYLGERVYDEDLLMYPEFHCFDYGTLPKFDIDRVVVGIDYGVSDNDSVIAAAWDSTARRGYVFFERKFNRLNIGAGRSQLEVLKSEVRVCWEQALDFFPTLSAKEANKRITWDADDSAQHLSQELALNVRCSKDPDLRIYISNAHKTDGTMMRDKIRDLLRTADLLLPSGSKVAEECNMTVYRRGPNGEVYPEVDDKVFHPDLLPALRYALWNVVGMEAVS
jgi:hypothetical protein